jgi:hypothetical protein
MNHDRVKVGALLAENLEAASRDLARMWAVSSPIRHVVLDEVLPPSDVAALVWPSLIRRD